MSNYDMSNYDSAGVVPHSGAERLAGVVSHGSMLLMMPMIWPIGVFLISPLLGPGGRYARSTAVQALLFQLVITTIGGGLLTIAGIFFGAAFLTGAIPLLGLILGPVVALLSWPAALVFGVLGVVVAVWGLWIELVATWKAFNGEP